MRAWLSLLLLLLPSCAEPGGGCGRCASGTTCRSGRCVALPLDAPGEDGGDDAPSFDAPADTAASDVPLPDVPGLDAPSCPLRVRFATAGETSFRPVRELDCSSPFAPLPTAHVEAVFDLEATDEAYFLTATTYHVLALGTLTWVASGARDVLFPEARGVTLRGAVGLELTDAGRESVYVLDLPTIYFYGVDPVTRTATLIPLSDGRPNPIDLTDASIYPNWQPGSNAFTPTTAELGQVRTAMHDSTGVLAPSREGVTCMGAARTCADTLPGIGSHFSALFTDSTVFLVDGYSCYCFFARSSASSFGPFGAAGAPARSEWDHTVWNGGLWAFETP